VWVFSVRMPRLVTCKAGGLDISSVRFQVLVFLARVMLFNWWEFVFCGQVDRHWRTCLVYPYFEVCKAVLVQLLYSNGKSSYANSFSRTVLSVHFLIALIPQIISHQQCYLNSACELG